MGCDGGSFEKRDEVVKVKKAPPAKDPKEMNRIRWNTCSVSSEPLREPIVADELGNLFNKEAILSALLHKTMPEKFAHIRGLRDVFELKFTPNPDFGKNPNASNFICPISRLETGNTHPFVALRPCGCVISRKALKEIPEQEGCLVCNKPKTDVIPINGTAEEVAELKKKLSEKVSSKKKKSSKSKSKSSSSSSASTYSEATSTSTSASATTTSASTSSTSTQHKEKSEKEKPSTTSEKESKKRKVPSPPSTTFTATTSSSSSSSSGPPPKLPRFIKPELVDSQVYSSIFTRS